MLTHTTLVFYEGSVEDKMRLAQLVYDTQGASLRSSTEVQRHLELLPKLAAELDDHMKKNMQMATLCSVCGSKPEGGCCSIEMAGNSDALLMIMNLLLDCPVEIKRDDGFECSFLSTHGCSLLLKPMFCLNYNCRKISRHNSKADMAKLELHTGNILRAQTRLEEIIIQLLPDYDYRLP